MATSLSKFQLQFVRKHTLIVYSILKFSKFKYTIQRPSSNPLPTLKIHTLSVYSIHKIPKFKYTIQQPASNPIPTLKIHTLSVYSFESAEKSPNLALASAIDKKRLCQNEIFSSASFRCVRILAISESKRSFTYFDERSKNLKNA